MLTTDQKRTRALNLINDAKKRGLSLDTARVKAALQTLVDLDSDRTVAWENSNKPGGAIVESQHHRIFHAPNEAGFTIGGVLVPVSQPPDPAEHDANLGWEEPPTPESRALKEHNALFSAAGDLLSSIVQWLASGGALTSIGLRAVALAAVTQPQVFEGCNGSQASIAAKFGVERAAIQKYCSQLRDLANGLQCRNTRPESMRHAARDRAIEQHRRAGHTMHGNA